MSGTLHKLEIVDCHVHFLDDRQLEYPHLQEEDASFVEFVGDYSEFPRHYLPHDYFRDAQDFHVVKTVMVEFMSTDPLKEAEWAQNINREGHPQAIVALVNLNDPNIEELLIGYKKLPKVKAVREHLLWDPDHPLRRSSTEPHMIMDKEWRKNFSLLQKYELNWEFEIFAHQIPEAIDLARAFPRIKMVLHPMGWPLDLTTAGFNKWKMYMREISLCPNVTLKITGISAIFRNWGLEEIKPWIREAIEIFTPQRAMFGSNMPFEKLKPATFSTLYNAYFDIVSDMSREEQQSLFHDTASTWYGI